ncbi:MAG: hypothetical protein LBK23_03305 [Oscillospiraceae bacterium]|jgi:ABC-type molybdate transport system ATPase subunit|nr:hypothetical protein [Oscillospiraceae bacterium]
MPSPPRRPPRLAAVMFAYTLLGIVALKGVSGSGKTTLLVTPRPGAIAVADEVRRL